MFLVYLAESVPYFCDTCLKTDIEVTMVRYQEVMVALTESVMKNRLKPHGGKITMTSYLACNKISLSRKPCIPEKSYYGTLSGSHGHSLRIRHEKSPEVPPGGGLTMTSCPVGNKTSLSR